MRKIVLFIVISFQILCADEVKSVKFDGLMRLSPDVARGMTSLIVGETITPEKIDIAIKNLFKQNYFDDIYVENSGGNLTFFVKERPSIAKIDIKGVATNDKKAITELIGIKQGNVYDIFSIQKAKERVRQFYELKGYFDTIVSVETKRLSESQNALELKFDINRGEKIIIEKINLIGAKKLSYGNIEPSIANKQKEILGFLWGFNDGGLKIFELPNDSARILDEYYKKGYLDAAVSTPYLNAFLDNYTAELTYNISEGERYKVGKISFDVPEFAGIDTNEVKDEFRLEYGDKMNSAKLRHDTAELENAIAQQGYAYAQVFPQMQKKAGHVVDINYKALPGKKVYVKNVVISGNEKTADKVIRRELYLTEGYLYNRVDIKDSTNALKRTGYFEDVDISEQRVDETQVNLLVKVKEAPTGAITGGIGYGSSDGLLLNASVSENNVFGTGIKLGLNVDRSDNELSGRISLTNPRIFDSRYSLGGSIYSSKYNWFNYEEIANGFTLSLDRQVGRNANISLGYILEQSDIRKLSPFLENSGYKKGKSIKSSVIPGIGYNSTDDYFLPREGVITSTSFEYAGVGGDEKFTALNTNFAWYKGLMNYMDYDLIFRYKARFQKVWDKGYLPINERLYLGGVGSIRGFESRSLSPRNSLSNDKKTKIGGEITFSNSAELSFPLINRIKMRGVLFFDFGTIGNKKIDEIYRYSMGTGIEWTTPIGPVQFIFAKPLNDKPSDDVNKFEFVIGRRF